MNKKKKIIKKKSIQEKPDIIYGNVELSREDIDLKNAKTRVTTFIDDDILKSLKEEAALIPGAGYQSILNDKLRQIIFGEKSKFIHTPLSDILHRLEIIESKIDIKSKKAAN